MQIRKQKITASQGNSVRQCGPMALLCRDDLRPWCADEPIKDEDSPADPNNGIESHSHASDLFSKIAGRSRPCPFPGMLILVSTAWTVGILLQRIATEFTIISYKNVPVGKSRISPRDSVFKQ